MPRIDKKLPANRSEWSFGELVYWHLFEFGTRPNIDPSAIAGRKWEPEALCGLLGITWKTLRNWIADKHFPDSTVALERELFGDNPAWEIGRRELAEALRKTRTRKAKESARFRRNKSTPAPVRPEEGQAPAEDQPAKPAEAGKVGKSETEKPEIPEKSTGAPSDSEEVSGTEEASNFRKSAAEGSGEDGDFPEEQPPAEQDDAAQSREDETPEPHAQSNQKETGDSEAKRLGDIPDILRSPHPARPSSRKITALLLTGAVLVVGIYVVTRPHRFEPRKVATASAPGTPAVPKKVPGPDARLHLSPQPAPVPQTPAKREELQPGPQAAPPAPPKPADQPSQTARQPTTLARPEEKKPTTEEQALIKKRKAEQAEEMKKRIAEAKQLDQEGAAGAKARAQRERERNANEVAGLGYRLFEYASVRGTSLGQVQTETVFDCAKACHDINCDAFAWYRDERPAGPRTCFRYRAPFTLEENTGYTAGKKVSALQGVKLSAAGGAAQVADLLAQGSPTEPEDDGVVHCPNGPVKVTGFDLTCDAMLVGGTTLGSHRLSWTVKNINECARKCQPIANCVGFTYNAAQQGGHSCVLFGPTPEKREDVPGWISGERPVQ